MSVLREWQIQGHIKCGFRRPSRALAPSWEKEARNAVGRVEREEP